MSLTPFRAIDPTTAALRRSGATLNKGQLARTLFLFVLCVVALAFAARPGHAAESGFHSYAADGRTEFANWLWAVPSRTGNDHTVKQRDMSFVIP